jgi:hypothetical protein
MEEKGQKYIPTSFLVRAENPGGLGITETPVPVCVPSLVPLLKDVPRRCLPQDLFFLKYIPTT